MQCVASNKLKNYVLWQFSKIDYMKSWFCLFQIRVGVPITHAYSPEDLLYKYGVDMHLQAHVHSYERTWPVYNNTVTKSRR